MRNYLFLFVLLCSACAKFTGFEGEKTAITQLIDDETKFVAAADWRTGQSAGSILARLSL